MDINGKHSELFDPPMMRLLLNLRGALSLSIITLNTVVWCTPLFVVALFKFIVPPKSWRKSCSHLLISLSEAWISGNNFVLRWISRVDISSNDLGQLSTQESYMVIANHSSWADILVMQKLFNRRIPFLKFFVKQQLIWVPVLGIAWWALDFPFMKRYSHNYLRKHPEKAGKDFEATRRACEKFTDIPVSIVNFIEGTRFTQAKHDRQYSPYQYLLKPKAGGVGYVLTMLGGTISKLVNVSIVYPGKVPGLWDFVCGRTPSVKVEVSVVEVPQPVKGDYINNPECRIEVQRWLNELWSAKNDWLAAQRAEAANSRY
jgi:1-acyl-sn-glycerol-3-phosphate acyltransferase